MSGARLWALIAVTMLAFAANSVLNRAAVGGGHIDALSFAVIRVLAGAAMLSLLVLLGRRWPRVPPPARFLAAGCLSLYLLGFSIAYVHLDAGLGALILFGGVQLTMFAAGLWTREPIPWPRWIGAAAALAGLAVLSLPLDGVGSAIGIAAMLLAALGWGGYSLIGRGSSDPLPETAAAFLIAVPLVWVPVLMLPVAPDSVPPTGLGYAFAIVSGSLTSGLGYALWYRVLPMLAASTAALIQLSAPLLAVLGGVVFLGEAVSLKLALATALILGGIAFGLQRKIGSSGS